MSDDTSAQPAVAQPTETASGAGADAAADSSAHAPVAPVVDTKTSESDGSSAAVADSAGIDKVKSEEGKVSPYNARRLTSAGFTGAYGASTRQPSCIESQDSPQYIHHPGFSAFADLVPIILN